MGLLDKAKFWKKEDDDVGDLSDLGDFGLDDKGGDDLGGGLGGDLGTGAGKTPSHDMPGVQPGTPAQHEEVQPTQGSQQMGDQLGLKPATPDELAGAKPQPSGPQPQAGPQPAPQPQPQAAPAQQQAPQQPYQSYQPSGQNIAELAKDIEIIHAKLDSIRSSLDSINQRLATLERIASGDTGKSRYSW